jgi:hypothetical protein
MIRIADLNAVSCYFITVGEMGEGMAPLIDQGHVDVGQAGILDVVFVLEKIFNVKKHGHFLLEGVISLEQYAQAREFLADRGVFDHTRAH